MNISDEKWDFSRFGGCPGEDPGILGVLASQPRRKGGGAIFKDFPPVEPAPRGWGWEAPKCWGDRCFLALLKISLGIPVTPALVCLPPPPPRMAALLRPKIGEEPGCFPFLKMEKKSGGLFFIKK